MSDERLLALMLAATGLSAGGALLMKPKAQTPELWYEIHWPRTVDEKGVTAFFRSLAGDRSSSVIALEIVAEGGKLSYRLGLTRRMASAATAALPSFVPGTMTTLITDNTVPAPTFAWAFGMSSHIRPLRQESAEIGMGFNALNRAVPRHRRRQLPVL